MALNKLLTRIVTIPELKAIWNEILFNTTSKVSKVSKTSVLNGVSYGVSKIAQKSMKDIAVIETQVFPEFATGQYLDNAARLWAGTERGVATGSSTYVRVKATQGTTYRPGENKFISNTGVEFDVVEQTTVGVNGFAYVKVRSINTGAATNIDPFTLNSVNPEPDGHIQCTNEYRAIGGGDDEIDEVFRERILGLRNIDSRDTISFILEILRLFDTDILRVFNKGVDDDYVINLAIVRANGAWFTNVELIDLEQKLTPYLSITDSISQVGQGFKLVNVEWVDVNLDFRVDIIPSFNVNDVRKNIQIAITKLLDFRFTDQRVVLWDDLLEVVKGVDGVRFVPTGNFSPSVDINVPRGQLPRVKSFKMRNLSGDIIFDSLNVFSPIFYQ